MSEQNGLQGWDSAETITKKLSVSASNIIIITILIIGAFIIFALNSNKFGDYVIGPRFQITISKVRLESSKNALDGSGNFVSADCVALGKLAHDFNKSADYFADCSDSNTALMYLDTRDTENKSTLVLSDDQNTATFVTDREHKKLYEYTFSNVKSAGFNKYGGRE